MNSTIRTRRWRKRNAIANAFQQAKASAKARYIEWEIDELQWWVFCLATNYHLLKGKSAESLTLDRIVEEEGYRFGNIQVLTMSVNTRKYQAYKKEQLRLKGQRQPDDPF